MATKQTNPVEAAWEKTRGDNPEFSRIDPEFRQKLQSVYADARAGRPESGIAGLEEFEREVRASVKAEGQAGDPTAPTLRDSVASQQAEPTPKGTGAQDSEEKALKDAKAAGQRVEADEVHSPSAPSAARPLAAEAPGNAPSPEERKATGKSSKRAASKTSAKSSATKTASKKSGSKK